MILRKYYPTIVLSDIHLGSEHSRTEEVTRFLKHVDCDRLILNGDIIDGWQLKKSGKRWKQKHTDFFKVLMKMKSVKEICRKYDLKTHEISYKIQLDKGSIRGGYYGSSDPSYIGRVDLFPNAFRDEDELLKTIIHENCHVLQFKKYGSIYVQHHMDRMEVVARRFESFFFYVKRLGEDKK